MSERLLGACGLVCSECDAFKATQAGDQAALAAVAAAWSKQFGADIPVESVSCDGCLTPGERKCGHCAECDIRACVAQHGYATCAQCSDFACDKLAEFLKMAGDGPREVLESLRA
jgi:Protein of unknown function (DUF3795)